MTDEILSLARQAASSLARRWGEDSQDIAQEILLHCAKNGIDGSSLLSEDDDEYEAAVRQLRSSMRWAGERYCRREKASKAGYSPEDEAFYGLRAIEELLAMYFQAGLTDRPPVGAADSVRRAGDPSEGGSYLASVLDAKGALGRVLPHYRQRLAVRLGKLGHLSDEKVASLSQSEIRDLTGMHHETLRILLGSTRDQVRHRTETALRAVQRELGGPSPWRGPPAIAKAS